MEIAFNKYQGTGNDFIMIDGRFKTVNISVEQLVKICHRRFGVGADGLIILKQHPEVDFEMDYYNADGSKSFCGNGSRCAQAFAKELGMIDDESTFIAIDGRHEGICSENVFATRMGDVNAIEEIGSDFYLHTGSPHYIRFVDELSSLDVEKEGRAIRNSADFREEGVNVNFVSIEGQTLRVRTYERGVEAETYSCGTGVTAAAISYLYRQNSYQNYVELNTLGGRLKVFLDRTEKTEFKSIWLEGPAEKVYSGSFYL